MRHVAACLACPRGSGMSTRARSSSLRSSRRVPWLNTCIHAGVNGGPPPAPDVVPLLRGVFACGALPAEDFTRKCHAMFSAEKMLQHAWVAEDCPAGAAEMAAEYFAKTEARRASPEFRDLRNSVFAALETHDARKAPMPPPAQGMPAGGAVRV